MRIKEYIKFRKIFNYYIKNGCVAFSSDEIGLKAKDLYYLNAKGVISITPYTNGDPNCRILVSDGGLTYHDDVLVSVIQFLVPTIISVVSLIISIFK